MPFTDSITAGTTELEAINTMLVSIGEAPFEDEAELEASGSDDAQTAIQVFIKVWREVLSMGWKFNTSFGHELVPLDTYFWVDTAGVTTVLNIFTPPEGMIGFKPTKTSSQTGWTHVDTDLRPSMNYLDEEDSPVLVFFDRMRNRDGFPADNHPFLYINPIWLFPFEQCPEVIRQYILERAGREFSEDRVGSETLARFSQQKEARALRNAVQAQGLLDDHSFLRNSDVSRARGGRPGGPSGVVDSRLNRGHVQ